MLLFNKLTITFITFSIENVLSYSIFINHKQASQILSRKQRSNSDMMEEMQSANFERECVQESCNSEEAREVFSSYLHNYSNHENDIRNMCFKLGIGCNRDTKT